MSSHYVMHVGASAAKELDKAFLSYLKNADSKKEVADINIGEEIQYKDVNHAGSSIVSGLQEIEEIKKSQKDGGY